MRPVYPEYACQRCGEVPILKNNCLFKGPLCAKCYKKELQNVSIGKTIDKHTFKICEAVALGLTHYYMGPNDKRELTKEESEKAKKILPSLPCGWFREYHDWDACNNYK